MEDSELLDAELHIAMLMMLVQNLLSDLEDQGMNMEAEMMRCYVRD